MDTTESLRSLQAQIEHLKAELHEVKGASPDACKHCHTELTTWMLMCPACGGQLGEAASKFEYRYLEETVSRLARENEELIAELNALKGRRR